MSATTPRLAQGSSDQRRLLAALGLVAVAVAILVAVAFGQQALRSSSAPAVNGAHDLIVKGTNGGAIRYTGIPYPAPVVRQSTSSGIPYPIPGVRKAESGIPYPIPGVRKATSTSTPAHFGHGKGGSARFDE